MEREIGDQIIEEALNIEPSLAYVDWDSASDSQLTELQNRIIKIKERLGIK